MSTLDAHESPSTEMAPAVPSTISDDGICLTPSLTTVTADEGVTDGMLGSPEGAVACTPDQERTPGGEPGGEPSMEASLTSPETAKKKAKGHPPGGQAFEKRIMEAISALGEVCVLFSLLSRACCQFLSSKTTGVVAAVHR